MNTCVLVLHKQTVADLEDPCGGNEGKALENFEPCPLLRARPLLVLKSCTCVDQIASCYIRLEGSSVLGIVCCTHCRLYGPAKSASWERLLDCKLLGVLFCMQDSA